MTSRAPRHGQDALDTPRFRIPLLITFAAGTRLHRERDLIQPLPILRNGPPGTFVVFPDGLRVSLPTDQIVHADETDVGARVGFGGMRFDGLDAGLLTFRRVRELRPEEQLSPARSQTMTLDPRWVHSVVVAGQDAWTAHETAAPGAVPDRWCEEPPPPLLLTGIEQFNRGEYFEQHETLEELWHAEARPVRRLYQGILQIGVALYHVRRGNHHGAVYMLGRGSMYLRPFAPTCQGVDVAALLEGAAATLAIVDTLGPARLDEFEWDRAPIVRLC